MQLFRSFSSLTSSFFLCLRFLLFIYQIKPCVSIVYFVFISQNRCDFSVFKQRFALSLGHPQTGQTPHCLTHAMGCPHFFHCLDLQWNPQEDFNFHLTSLKQLLAMKRYLGADQPLPKRQLLGSKDLISPNRLF